MKESEVFRRVKLHQRWLSGQENGERLVLERVDLKHIDFAKTGVSLNSARFVGCRIESCRFDELSIHSSFFIECVINDTWFKRSNLDSADFSRSRITSCDFSRACMMNCILSECWAIDTKFYFAGMPQAVLRSAQFDDCDFTAVHAVDVNARGSRFVCCNFRCADLRSANFSLCKFEDTGPTGATLYNANLQGSTIPPFQICPLSGSFTAWKWVNGSIVELEIPAEAKRTSSLAGRKCRAEFALVKSAEGYSDGELVGVSRNDCEYIVGQVVWADKYDDDIQVECTSGIHFFMTRAEAEAWGG